MQNKKLLLIILCCALVLLIGLLGAAVYIMMSDGSGASDNLYQQQLDLGNSYLENDEYDQAIAAFRAAISADPGSVEAYYQLAILYSELNRMDDMKAVLLEGIDRTNAEKLRALYVQYFGDDDTIVSDKEQEGGESAIYISDSMTTIVANYTYEDYGKNYASANIQPSSEIYRVTFSSLDAALYFYDENDQNSINENAGRPFDEVRPNYIVFGNLSYIIAGLDNNKTVSIDTLESMGASNISTLHDAELGNYVKFIYNHTVFEISTDSNDSFNMNSEHRIYSEFGTAAETAQTKFVNTIKIVSATTGNGVSGATVTVYKDNSVEDTATTNSTGYADIELYAGIYTVKVECDEYVTESFEIEIFNTGMCSEIEFIISPELGDGQVRIVLEWGDYPRDLDSYLVDSTGTVRISYRNKTWYEDGRLIAELDVDDTNGYGPETITVYDTSIDFTYFVHDYNNTGDMFSSSGASVKVYTSDGGFEQYTVPNDNSGSYGWCVFSYINGDIIMRNNIVADIPDFRHYN